MENYNIMKNLFNFYSLIAVACFCFTSCAVEDSADVNQDKIYTDYEVFYNSNTDKTTVLARFRFGGATGTLLQLNDPAMVTYNGEELSWNPVLSGHSKEFAGQINGGSFIYTNIDGGSFENAAPAWESIGFPNDLDTLTRSSSYDLKWDGTALGNNQRVGIFAGSWAWGQDAAFVQLNEGSDNIILGKDQLDDLPVGQTTLYMDRTTEQAVVDGTSEGGLIRGKFRAENRVVLVVD